jgi:hypothetical protein
VTGTVGEWLRYAAAPLERKNFEELLRLLEEFQYDRGLAEKEPAPPRDGVIVHLGPMLHAKLTFHVSST